MNTKAADSIRFGVGVSVESDSKKAVQEACQSIKESSKISQPELAMLFLTQHHEEHFEEILATIHKEIQPKCLLGCTAGGVIGGEREIENRAGLVLWAGQLPGAKIQPFHLRFDQKTESLEGWPEPMPEPGEKPSFLLLPDPFTTPAELVLQHINHSFPGAALFGGIASGAVAPGQNRLFFNSEIYEEGAVGAIFTGAIEIRNVVSQGCRPVGKPLVVTQAEKNIIQSLGGKPALEKLQEIFATLAPVEQQLLQRGMHIGIVVDELKENFRRGDFIVRNVMGADPKSGAIAIGDYIRKGQTVQLHVRDANSAHEDLQLLLEQEKGEAKNSAQAALLFSCNGRGMHLFGEPNHDIKLTQELLGKIPVAGFFAGGEIGPIGGKNFLHGFTASIATFSKKAN